MTFYGPMSSTRAKRRLKLKPTLKRYSEGEYKWVVYFQGEDGKRARRKFKQKNDANGFLADKQVELENLGNRIASTLDDSIKREAYAAMELLKPFGKTLLDAAKYYHAHLEATARSATLEQAIQEFTLAMEKAGKSSRYLGDLRVRLSRFLEPGDTRMCAEISTRFVAQWLERLKVSNTTRNNFRRVLCTFFSWCVKMGYSPDNPILGVNRAKSAPNSIQIYTPKQMCTLLYAASTWQLTKDTASGKGHGSHNASRDILANMAICGFAGLRQAEFERLEWQQIKVDRGVIDLSAAITKTATRRLVTIRPVLNAWFAHMGAIGTGLVRRAGFPRRLQAFRRYLKETYNLEWKHNALRHSFASYLMEHVQNPGEVSLQLGHNDAGVVFAHYRELVTISDANEFWGLTPESVLRGDEVNNH